MFDKLIGGLKKGFSQDIDEDERNEEAMYDDIGAGTQGRTGGMRRALNSAQLDAVFSKIDQFSAARDVADSINEKKLVVVNLEDATKETARRIVDFLSGVAYANSATLSRIASSTFVVTPYFVETVDEMRGALDISSFDGVVSF